MLRALSSVLVALSVACSSPDPTQERARDFLREIVSCLEHHRDAMVHLGYPYEAAQTDFLAVCDNGTAARSMLSDLPSELREELLKIVRMQNTNVVFAAFFAALGDTDSGQETMNEDISELNKLIGDFDVALLETYTPSGLMRVE